ncbi:hypothetical protein BS50DRAFT_579888, partial [Corynespora cassiicola Philippines]
MTPSSPAALFSCLVFHPFPIAAGLVLSLPCLALPCPIAGPSNLPARLNQASTLAGPALPAPRAPPPPPPDLSRAQRLPYRYWTLNRSGAKKTSLYGVALRRGLHCRCLSVSCLLTGLLTAFRRVVGPGGNDILLGALRRVVWRP